MATFNTPVTFLGTAYSDSAELKKDIDSEIDFCKFIPQQFRPSDYQSFLSSLKQKVSEFDNAVTTAQSQNASNLVEIVSNKTREVTQEISNKQSNKPQFNHKSPEGRQIIAVASGNPTKGKGAYLGLSSQRFQSIEESISPDLISGLIAISEFKSNLTNNLTEVINNVLSDTDKKSKLFSEQVSSLNSQLEDLKKKSSEQLKNQSDEFKKHSDDITKKVTETLSESQKKLEEREKTLAEKLRLNASVQYWRDRKNSAWWFITISSIFALIIPVILFFIFSWLFGKTIPEALKIMVHSSSKTGIPNFAYSSIFIVCSIAMFYAISSFFKLVFNQVNIINICMENITKAQYFLALVNEEALKKDDKEIKTMMLKSIFESKHPHLSAGNAFDSLPIKQVINNGKE